MQGESAQVAGEASSVECVSDDDIHVQFLSMVNVQDLQIHTVEDVATFSRCPLCRAPLSLLDMSHVSTGIPVWASAKNICKKIETTPLAGKIYATRRGIGYNSFHFPPFSDEEDKEHRENDDRPYFLWQDDDALYLKSEESGNENVNDEMEATEGDENSSPKKYFFEPGYFYFRPTMTFQGRLFLPDAHGNPQQHDVVLSFANNHRWITGGMMLRYHVQEFDNLEASQKYYPFEGRWRVTWYRERLSQDASLEGLDHLTIASDHIDIIANRVVDDSPLSYQLKYTKNGVYFHWPGHGTTQTLERESDFYSSPNNAEEGYRIPAVGDYLKWITMNPSQPYIVWQRETIADVIPSAPTSIEYFGRSGGQTVRDPMHVHARSGVSWYRQWEPSVRTLSSESNPGTEHGGRPQYHSDQLWGNTFCQGLRVGLASYHFGLRSLTGNALSGDEQEQGELEPYAYISYQHPMCGQWPPLDDGSPIPARVYFHDISVSEIDETRRLNQRDEDENGSDDQDETFAASHIVFRGNIEWLQDYGTTWQNNERWEYEMHFDSQLACILSGTVHCISSDSSRQEMSHYGSDLVYINAGILNAFEDWLRQEVVHNEHAPQEVMNTTEDSFRRYTQVSRALRRRLQNEGASVRTVAMLNMVLTMSQQPGGADPLDYNET